MVVGKTCVADVCSYRVSSLRLVRISRLSSATTRRSAPTPATPRRRRASTRGFNCCNVFRFASYHSLSPRRSMSTPKSGYNTTLFTVLSSVFVSKVAVFTI